MSCKLIEHIQLHHKTLLSKESKKQLISKILGKDIGTVVWSFLPKYCYLPLSYDEDDNHFSMELNDQRIDIYYLNEHQEVTKFIE